MSLRALAEHYSVFAYLGCLAGLLLAIAHGHSAWWVAGVVAITKACDSGAYFTGRALGKHKMIPWLSPGKTWEGAIGGVLAAIGVAALLIAANDAWLDTPLPWWMIPALGLGLANLWTTWRSHDEPPKARGEAQGQARTFCPDLVDCSMSSIHPYSLLQWPIGF